MIRADGRKKSDAPVGVRYSALTGPVRLASINKPAAESVLGNKKLQLVRADVSARMSAVRQRDTAPELAVRHIVFSLGARYRVCCRNLPGHPDLANVSHAWCIFVHGCFWHGHNCTHGRLPKTNLSFWGPKIIRNRARDAEVLRKLRARGLRVLTVWQCEIAKPLRLRARLAEFLHVSALRLL